LTAFCPFDFGGPDFYSLTIRYRPDGYVVESKSLKKYLQSYRNTEISAEELATEIHRDIGTAISPESLYVKLEQARRGGIKETVEVGDHDVN
jgi:7-cyano-7-deazaguanine reductase